MSRTILVLRAFMGFTNYYSTYVKDYGRVVARLKDKLTVPRDIKKKGLGHRLGETRMISKFLKRSRTFFVDPSPTKGQPGQPFCTPG